jgi:hypothetical protein
MNVPHQRAVAFALVIAAAAAGQIVQGSFESAVAGGTSVPSPWTSTAGFTQVMPFGGCGSEPAIGFPSDGSKWVRIASGGGPATTSSYAFTTNVSQTFTTGAAGTQLHLDVAFCTGEGAGSFYNDFLAVSVTSGATTLTLLTLETATATFPNTACLTLAQTTAKNTIVADLATLFPGLTPTTPVTLRVHCANGIDDAVTSYAYVDNAYLGTPPPPPIDLNFVNNGGGMWTLQVAAPGFPNAECRNLFSLVTLNPTGTGPIFGINFDSTVLAEITSPYGSHPFHIGLDASGNYALGPIGIPGGLAADGVSIAVSGGQIVAVSTAEKFLF